MNKNIYVIGIVPHDMSFLHTELIALIYARDSKDILLISPSGVGISNNSELPQGETLEAVLLRNKINDADSLIREFDPILISPVNIDCDLGKDYIYDQKNYSKYSSRLFQSRFDKNYLNSNNISRYTDSSPYRIRNNITSL
jgi:hypothetical protein